MRTVIVYESMYGATHALAERMGEALGHGGTVDVVPVGGATCEMLDGADLVLVGGPTHMHGMTTPRSRHAAIEAAAKPDATVHVDPDSEGPGLRDWFEGLDGRAIPAAAFDTRMHGPAILTGRASRGIDKRLRKQGFTTVADPESFLVDKDGSLTEGEVDRAAAWAQSVAGATRTTSAPTYGRSGDASGRVGAYDRANGDRP